MNGLGDSLVAGCTRNYLLNEDYFQSISLGESENALSLWYSCHELCSSLLTETQWIYRNLICPETKPGHRTVIAPGHDKQEIPVMCELV